MRTMITRLYADTAAAQTAYDALREKNRISPENLTIVESSETAGPMMRAAGVTATAARTYEANFGEDMALLVLRAPYGAARRAIETLTDFPSVDVGLASENIYVSPSSTKGSVLTSHPLLAMNPYRPLPHGHIFGDNPVTHSPSKSSVIEGGAYISKWFVPIQLVWRDKKPKTSAIPGGFLFSSLFSMPTISHRKPNVRVS